MHQFKLWKVAWLVPVLLSIAACSSQPPPLAPVSGTLRKADGKPVAGAYVQLWPVENTAAFLKRYKTIPSSRPTDSKGAFEMRVTNDQTGIPPGRYKVTAGMIDSAAPYQIPASYNDADRTPWEVTVPREGNPGLTFQVE